MTRPAVDPAVELPAEDDGLVLGRPPEWAINRALGLVKEIREADPADAVERNTRDLAHDELRALAAVLAALVRADVDVEQALEWVDLPPREWSDATVVIESGRWDDGARDYVAARGYGQWRRRGGDRSGGSS